MNADSLVLFDRIRVAQTSQFGGKLHKTEQSVLARMAGRGLALSSVALAEIEKALFAELGDLASSLIAELGRVLDADVAAPTDEQKECLRSLYMGNLDHASEQVAAHVSRSAHKMSMKRPPLDSSATYRSTIRPKWLYELDLLLMQRDAKAAVTAPISIVTYHLSGANSRVTNGTDSSVNNVTTTQLFESMLAATNQQIESPSEKEKLIQLIEALRAEQGQKRGFFARYSEFMAAAANHVSVFAPFLPALGQLAQQVAQ